MGAFAGGSVLGVFNFFLINKRGGVKAPFWERSPEAPFWECSILKTKEEAPRLRFGSVRRRLRFGSVQFLKTKEVCELLSG